MKDLQELNHSAECLSIPFALSLKSLGSSGRVQLTAAKQRCSIALHLLTLTASLLSVSRLYSPSLSVTCKDSICLTYSTILSHYPLIFFHADWISVHVIPLFSAFVCLLWGHQVRVFEGWYDAVICCKWKKNLQSKTAWCEFSFHYKIWFCKTFS